jgi:serine/threonine protein kinase/tetratricopeptide (TPR) repeat protein
MIGRTVAHYRIDRQLGEGGMGVVYAAQDLKLERPVALKVIRAELGDPVLRERFWREARAAAALNHPNICHLYEISEEGGSLFITMELLEGETLADRLARGPLTVPEALRVGLDVLAALEAVHKRGFVHRDVKPSNVFLLADGRAKLLDFGLAQTLRHGALVGGGDKGALTLTGMVVGSPRYMTPEQIRGTAVDGRTDLFALATVLHEAVTGRPAFGEASPVEMMYAVLNDRAPAVGSSPELSALGRVLSRAMAKSPEGRYSDAATMANDLRNVRDRTPTGTQAPVDRVVRLAVLPFRMLRPDSDFDFLGPSLADAIVMQLAGLRSLIVRSSMASARFASPTPDLAEIGRALEVDMVLLGTVLPAGGRCRVQAQLVEAADGQVVWSQTAEASGGDVFEIQDMLVRRIVDSLQLPLSSHERYELRRDVPASPAAYEYFLRANQIAVIGKDINVARALYLQAVEADPTFAPAWARLGRSHRIVAKYLNEGRPENYKAAEEALGRALELHPDLPSALHYMAQLELDHGRVEAALDRLLPLVERNPNDAEGHAGLILAFRYAGMLDASLAAHQRVRRLDPALPTSVHYTLLSLGETERALEERDDALGTVRGWLLAKAGREEEAIRLMREVEVRERGNLAGWGATLFRAALEGDRALGEEALRVHSDFPDPEGTFVHATVCARLGLPGWAVDLIESTVDRGYANVAWIENDPWLAPLRDDPRYRAAVERARRRHEELARRYAGRPAHLPAGRS